MSSSITGQLTCSHRTYADHTIVAASGEIDLATTPYLRQTLYELIGSGHRRLILDLTEVSFCESVGLGVMVGALRRINDRYSDGHLWIVCGDSPVRRVFEITGLHKVFTIFSNLADTREHTTGPPGPLQHPEHGAHGRGARGPIDPLTR